MRRIISPSPETLSVLRQPLTAGEKAVLALFHRSLPPDWEIYIQPHLNGLRPDFVLLNPAVGVGVFEVKDWNLGAMHYFTEKDSDGNVMLWAEKDGEKFCIQSQNPVTKARRYKKEIYDLYCPRVGQDGRSGKHDGWAAITAGVIFPFAPASSVKLLLAPFLSGPESDDYARYQPVSGQDEITSGRVDLIFPESTRARSRLMNDALANDLRGWLVEPDFATTQRLPLELDRKQRALADARTGSGYRRIKGPAGSGKSLVLAARAAKLINEGKQVLVITFNITLWHYLRDLMVRDADSPEKMRNVRLSHFHYWCKQVCYDIGWGAKYESLVAKMQNASSQFIESMLNETIPALAARAIEHPAATRYDAILVDEGQDYRPNWWTILRKACVADGEMMLVADATQDIYGTATAWTDEVMQGAGFRGAWAQLDISYRLPPRALDMARDFARQFLPAESSLLPEQEQGSLDIYPCTLRWVQCSPEEAILTCVDEILAMMALTGKDGLANADITLLSAHVKAGASVVSYLDEHYRIKSVNTFNTDGVEQRRQKMGFYMGDARVKATTLHSFKGWESRLLVVHIAQAGDAAALALIYAGLTRLKRHVDGSWLTVVCSASELEQFGSGWPDYASTNRGGSPYRKSQQKIAGEMASHGE